VAAPVPSGGGAHRGPKGDEYWPFRGPGSASSSSGSGTIPAYVEPGADDDSVPGRSWLRLAAVVALVLLVVVVLAVAFNISRGRTPLGREAADPTPTPSLTGSPSPTASDLVPLEGVAAADFDPQGDPPEENPDDAGNVVDGDPGTSWSTSTYQQQLGPQGLKTGVGLLLDLGDTREVAAVTVALGDPTTEFALFLADRRPTDVEGLTALEVDELPGGTLGLPDGSSGRYLVVWLTALSGTDDGRFQGEVVDVEVLGR
jgi:hypothetical protein